MKKEMKKKIVLILSILVVALIFLDCKTDNKNILVSIKPESIIEIESNVNSKISLENSVPTTSFLRLATVKPTTVSTMKLKSTLKPTLQIKKEVIKVEKINTQREVNTQIPLNYSGNSFGKDLTINAITRDETNIYSDALLKKQVGTISKGQKVVLKKISTKNSTVLIICGEIKYFTNISKIFILETFDSEKDLENIEKYLEGKTTSSKEIEKMYNELKIQSKTNQTVYVDLKSFTIFALFKEDEIWKVVKSHTISHGIIKSETLVGEMTIKGKTLTMYSGRSEYYYGLKLVQNYKLHSILYYTSNKKVCDGRLGYKISNGCIRQSKSNAKWMYDNLEIGTSVIIR